MALENRRKAQAALEYMITVSIALLILTPFLLRGYDAMTGLGQNSNILLAKNSLDKVSEAAKIVYSQGPPAKMTVKAQFPHNLLASNVSQKELSLSVRKFSSSTDIVAFLDFNVTGSLPYDSGGMHTIVVEALQDGTVNVTCRTC